MKQVFDRIKINSCCAEAITGTVLQSCLLRSIDSGHGGG